MFKKKEESANFENISTFLAKDIVIDGKIDSKGTLRIDGKVNGEINCEGDLVIGEGGVVESDIKVKNILVAGKVNGSITAKGKVEMASTGSISGDISVSSLIIDDGAAFEGKCTMHQGSGKAKEKEQEKFTAAGEQQEKAK